MSRSRAAASLAVAACAVAACSGGQAGPAGHVTTVSVSVSACGRGWSSGPAGAQSFRLRNTDVRAGEVDLVDARTGAVYAEVDPLGPGTSTALHARLGAGRYAFRCAMEDEPAITGPAVRLTGPAHGDTPAVPAVSQGDLITAAKAYQGYVTRKLPGLLAATTRLRADIDAGRPAAARRDWLPAHVAYLGLGAAYDAFGDLDTAIDARADDLPRGVHDRSWRGLHRLEYGLWHGQSAAQLRAPAAALVGAVRQLIKAFPGAQIDPLTISLRAHEITEDAVEFALTGRDDYGSHTGLAAVAADLDGTRVVLGLVRALLAPRYPGLRHLSAQLDRAAADVAALRRPDGSWPALSALRTADRERVDGDVGQLAELLAPVAAILQPRRTS